MICCVPEMLILLETKVEIIFTEEISSKIKFEHMHRLDANSHKGDMDVLESKPGCGGFHP